MTADKRTMTHRQLVQHLARDMLAACVVIALLPLAAAHATTLTNGPAHPLRPREFASVQRWLNESAVPIAPSITVHRGECPTAVACANVDFDGTEWFESVGSIWIGGSTALHDRFAVMHEMGHVMDAETYTPAKRGRIERLLRMTGDWMPDARYWDGSTPPFERAADAYATCSIHRRWPGTWWHWTKRLKDGTTVGGGNPTPFDFRAGRRRYTRICSAIRAAG